MVKLRKDEIADLDVADLDAAEYSESDFDTYSGRIPDDNTELYGYVAAMWWCRTAEKDDGTGLDPMIKVLWIAADNDGDLAEFNGLPVVENLVLVKGAKFRWAPFLNVFGITLKAIKTATYVAEEDDERWGGAPIERIGEFRPGQDNDGAWSRVITKKRYYNERWSAEAKKWLPWETEDDQAEAVDDSAEEEVDDEAAEEYDEETAEEEYDTEDEDTEDEEPEDEEEEAESEPPARGRRAAAKPARASTRTAAKPAAARPAGKRAAAKPAAAATSSRGRRPAAAAKPASGRPARGKRPAADNEPPF